MARYLVSPCRQLEVNVPIGKAGEVAREIEYLLADEIDDLPFSLDPAIDRHHRESKHDASALLE